LAAAQQRRWTEDEPQSAGEVKRLIRIQQHPKQYMASAHFHPAPLGELDL
jgi:hypothetical protein